MMLFVCCHLSNVVFALMWKVSASSRLPNSREDEDVIQKGRKAEEREDTIKNLKGVKTIGLPFSVSNSPEPNKDSLMDLFDRRLDI